MAPHWENRAACATCGQVTTEDASQCSAKGHRIKTVGQHFASLDRGGQRVYLAEYEIRAWQPVKGQLPLLSIVHRALTAQAAA